MSYRIEEKEEIVKGVKRAALEQLEKAQKSLKDIEDDPEESIHDIRKRLKKVRAVLRLLRKSLPSEVYAQENGCWRDLGRLLSQAREAAVNVETLDTVTREFAESVDPEDFKAVRRSLVARRDRIHQDVLASDVPKTLETELNKGLRRMDAFCVDKTGFGAVAGGLAKVYKRGRNALDNASDDPTPEAMHEWRKRVKYLWYHLRLLHHAWPEMMDPLAERLHQLATVLGDQHDMARFRQMTTKEDDDSVPADRMAAALALVGRRYDELGGVALDVGRRFYVESPSDFVDRMEAYAAVWKTLRPER